MAVNKNALIRYKTIDKCLQNRYREWTLDDLIDACSDALYEYEGKDTYVSKRTVQLDIQMMRSDKLGYNAPIVVYNRKYYTYEDEQYSITNIPLSDHDLGKLSESVAFLKQFQGFSHFRELDGMIQKLEAHVYAQKTHQKSVIDFEKNEHLKGLDFLDQLYQAIINKQCLKITYKSFKARQENTFNFHPYVLKEFRNRWFLIGCKKPSQPIMNIALDRIIAVEKSELEFKPKLDFDAERYFKDAIGVSVSPNLPADKIILFITHKHAPYVLTKPFHASQKIVEKDAFGVTISLQVQHNFELEKEILGLGDACKVIAPARLRRNIKDRLHFGLDLYNTEVTESNLKRSIKKLNYNGFSVLNNVYGTRELRKIRKVLDQHFTTYKEQPFALRCLLQKIPDLKELLLNKNLQQIITSIDKKAVLTKAIYFDKPAQKKLVCHLASRYYY
jgi:predicted DNA-binding transcriptional regulator YafY